VECWTWPREQVEQGTKLLVKHGKNSKAESRGGVKSQTPKEAASTQKRLGDAQRLRSGVGWQVKLSKEPLETAEDGRSTKAEGRGGVTDQPLKEEQVVDPGADMWDSIQNWILPPCWRRRWPNIAAAEGQHSCHLAKRTALTTLYNLAALPHLTIPVNLVDKMTNATHNPVT
jgi:hypothetical protein